MTEESRNKPLYMISVAAELTGMHPQTLRVYESKGLVNPKRSGGNTRLYSQADIERLELINQLTDEGSREADPAKRKALYAEWVKAVNAEIPVWMMIERTFQTARRLVFDHPNSTPSTLL